MGADGADGFEEVDGGEEVGFEIAAGIGDGVGANGVAGEVDDGGGLDLSEQGWDVAGAEVKGVGRLEIGDVNGTALGAERGDEMGADEAGSAGDENLSYDCD